MSKVLKFEQWLESEKKRDSAFGDYSEDYLNSLYELYVEANTFSLKKHTPSSFRKKYTTTPFRKETAAFRKKDATAEALEILNISIIELAKLTKATLYAMDLKDLTDVLLILESEAFRIRAVDEFMDSVRAEFKRAIKERVDASANKQSTIIHYSNPQISAKVDELVATCIEIGRPMLLAKGGIRDAGNFDGINGSKISKTKKWKD